MVHELKDAVDKNTAELKIQFERIAQLQAEVDLLRAGSNGRGSRRTKPQMAVDVAADRRSYPR
jgi:hypothetical protein